MKVKLAAASECRLNALRYKAENRSTKGRLVCAGQDSVDVFCCVTADVKITVCSVRGEILKRPRIFCVNETVLFTCKSSSGSSQQ